MLPAQRAELQKGRVSMRTGNLPLTKTIRSSHANHEASSIDIVQQQRKFGKVNLRQLHSIASLYEAFDPATALALAARLEIHYTPKHGSWLNMAETELSVLSRQCLDRRLESKAFLTQEVTTWEKERNQAFTKIDWRFTTADARVKLKRLYPSYQV